MKPDGRAWLGNALNGKRSYSRRQRGRERERVRILNLYKQQGERKQRMREGRSLEKRIDGKDNR